MFNLVLALLAGVVTVAAPCTLPMLPILLGASVGQTGKARPAMIALGFVLSFSAVALLLSAITRLFDFDPDELRSAAAILLLGFGLLMIWPAPFEWLSGPLQRAQERQRRRRHHVPARQYRRLRARHDPRPGLDAMRRSGARFDPDDRRDVQGYRAGRARCLWSTPSAPRSRCWRLPMADRPSRPAFAAIARISPRLQQGFGVVVIAFAIASYFQYDTLIVAWLTGFYPNGQIGL